MCDCKRLAKWVLIFIHKNSALVAIEEARNVLFVGLKRYKINCHSDHARDTHWIDGRFRDAAFFMKTPNLTLNLRVVRP
jgi:hypothetical protein